MTIATRFEWPSSGDAAENAEQLRCELSARLAEYEQRYHVPSSELARKVAEGSIAEDSGVCDWMMAIDALRALESGQQTQLA